MCKPTRPTLHIDGEPEGARRSTMRNQWRPRQMKLGSLLKGTARAEEQCFIQPFSHQLRSDPGIPASPKPQGNVSAGSPAHPVPTVKRANACVVSTISADAFRSGATMGVVGVKSRSTSLNISRKSRRHCASHLRAAA